MLKAKELRDQTAPELEALVLDYQKKLYELRNKREKEKKTDNPAEIETMRHDIARIKTVLNEKKLAR